MKNTVASTIFLFSFLCVATVRSIYHDKQITCYFRNWSQYGRKHAKFLPEDVDARYCNILKYAFLRININTFMIETTQPNDAEMLAKFVALKKVHPQFRIIIAIGGWSHEYLPRFSRMSAISTTRQTFIQSVIKFLQKHNLDGVSYNWIYPGTRGHGRPEKEKKKFSLLVKDTYEAFVRASNNGMTRRYYLSAAVSPSTSRVYRLYEASVIQHFVDSVDIMTNSLWSHNKAFTGTSTAMKGTANTIINSVEAWIQNGMPPSKISIGFALYGHTFTLADAVNNSLGASTLGLGQPSNITRTKGILAYYEICSRAWKYQTTWYASKTKTAYASDEHGVWVSFDDPKSLSYKLYYLLQKYNLYGVSLWALDFDDFTGLFCNAGKFPLLKQISWTMEAIESRLPPVTCRKPVNLGFLLDSSFDVKWYYSKLKKFIRVIASSIGIQRTGSRAAVMTYGNRTEESITLEDNYDIYSFSASVNALPFVGGVKNLKKALKMAQENMFRTNNVARIHVPNVLILLTTGSLPETTDFEASVAVAQQLRAEGVHLLVVGVNQHRQELEIIAGDTEDVFVAQTFGELLGTRIVDDVNRRMCPQIN